MDWSLDTAGQEGTGSRTVVEALELGNPVTLLEEAVFGRVHAEPKSSR